MEKKKSQISKFEVSKLVFTLLNLVVLILCCLLLEFSNKYTNVGILLLFLVLTAFFASATENHPSIYKIAIVVSVIAIVVVTAYIIMLKTDTLKYLSDFDAIKEFILGTKQWGVITFLLLTIFQVVVLPIPAAVTVLIGVVIYGPTVSFLLSTLGTYIGSMIAFWLGRKFGTKVVIWMVGEENTKKYAAFLGEKGKGVFFLTMLFPFFPDDIICMVAGTTSIKWLEFFLIVCLARPVMLAFFSYFGSGEIIPFSGWGIPVWCGIFVAGLLLLFAANKLKNKWFGDKKQKNKTKEDEDKE